MGLTDLMCITSMCEDDLTIMVYIKIVCEDGPHWDDVYKMYVIYNKIIYIV